MQAALDAFPGAAGWDGFALAVAAVLLAGFLRGFTGFGAALIVVPALSAIYSPTVAVPIAFLSGLPSVFQLLPTVIRHGNCSSP